MMVEEVASPKITLRLHAMVCTRARAELHRQWEELRRRSRPGYREMPRAGHVRVDEIDPTDTAILKTLLYFDIWNHPLTLNEIHTFLPLSTPRETLLSGALHRLVDRGLVEQSGEHYSVRGPDGATKSSRLRKERRAIFMWRMARIVTAFIKMFPFVRAVWVSGELSKNIASPHADIDFFIVTEPGRLWITRSMLILFKKIVLLNNKKFFCLNSFIDTQMLESSTRNIYQAIEIASLKPLFNRDLLQDYLRANAWIWSYFPNFDPDGTAVSRSTSRRSRLQRAFEKLFGFVDADALDDRLMRTMQFVWKKRYPGMDDATRDRILRSTKKESRAYLGDFEERILEAYRRNLRAYHIAG